MFKHDIKRMLSSWGFWGACFLFVVVGIIQQLSIINGGNSFESMLADQGFLFYGFVNRYIFSTCGDGISAQQMAFVLPVIVSIPCANFFLQEKKSRYLRNILVRTTRKKYIASKIFSAAFSGMLVVAIGEVLLFIICFICDPHISPGVVQTELFGQIGALYAKNIWKFTLLESVNLMVFGCVYCLMTLAFSVVWNNKYLSYTTVFLFANVIIDELHNLIKTPWITSDITLFSLSSQNLGYADVLIQYGVVAVFSIAIFSVVFLIRSKNDV